MKFVQLKLAIEPLRLHFNFAQLRKKRQALKMFGRRVRLTRKVVKQQVCIEHKPLEYYSDAPDDAVGARIRNSSRHDSIGERSIAFPSASKPVHCPGFDPWHLAACQEATELLSDC
jgi:hypothetical protein